MKTLGYGRVSKLDLDRVGGETTLDIAANQQKRRLERYGCEEIFFDVQRGTDDDRPQFETIMERVRLRLNCDRVVITRDDRITRNVAMTLQILETFALSGCELIILEEGDRPVDLSNPYEWKRRVSAGLDAQFEIKMLGLRVRRGYEDLRLNLKANPRCPFGYQRSKAGFYEPHPEQFDIAQKIIRTFLELKVLSKTCTTISQKFGIHWKDATLRRWILNEVLRGNTPRFIDPATGKPREIDYETHLDLAIVSPDQDKLIRAILQENAKYWGQNANVARHPAGGGLCKCDRCGGSMVCRTRKNRYYLICNNFQQTKNTDCKCDFHHTPPGWMVEEEIIKALCEKSKEIAEMAIKKTQPKPSQEIQTLLKELDGLQRMNSSNESILLAIQETEKKINRLQKQNNAEPVDSCVELLKKYGEVAENPDYWRSLLTEEKRYLFRTFVDRVTIGACKRASSRFVDYQISVILKL